MASRETEKCDITTVCCFGDLLTWIRLLPDRSTKTYELPRDLIYALIVEKKLKPEGYTLEERKTFPHREQKVQFQGERPYTWFRLLATRLRVIRETIYLHAGDPLEVAARRFRESEKKFAVLSFPQSRGIPAAIVDEFIIHSACVNRPPRDGRDGHVQLLLFSGNQPQVLVDGNEIHQVVDGVLQSEEYGQLILEEKSHFSTNSQGTPVDSVAATFSEESPKNIFFTGGMSMKMVEEMGVADVGCPLVEKPGDEKNKETLDKQQEM